MGARDTRRKRILVVDDDIRTTTVFAKMLREDGHDVDVVHDGKAAIEQLEQAVLFDILVTDIHMPHADGFTVAKYARDRYPLLPIIFVTGYPDRVSRRAKTLDSLMHVFVKPLDYSALSLQLLSITQNPAANRNTQ